MYTAKEKQLLLGYINSTNYTKLNTTLKLSELLTMGSQFTKPQREMKTCSRHQRFKKSKGKIEKQPREMCFSSSFSLSRGLKNYSRGSSRDQ